MKFNVDSPIFQFLSTLVDFIALNLIFLLTCIPVVTIGPALSALYTVTMREARGEHGYMIKPYFQAFRSNFKSGVGLFLIYFILGAIFLFNISFWMNMHTTVGNVAFVILVIVTVIYTFSFIYVFALNARFENTIKQTIKNSLFIPFTSLGTSLLMILIPAVVVILCYLMPAFQIMVLFFGFSFIAYCESFLFVKVFKKFEPEEGQADESDAAPISVDAEEQLLNGKTI